MRVIHAVVSGAVIFLLLLSLSACTAENTLSSNDKPSPPLYSNETPTTNTPENDVQEPLLALPEYVLIENYPLHGTKILVVVNDDRKTLFFDTTSGGPWIVKLTDREIDHLNMLYEYIQTYSSKPTDSDVQITVIHDGYVDMHTQYGAESPELESLIDTLLVYFDNRLNDNRRMEYRGTAEEAAAKWPTAEELSGVSSVKLNDPPMILPESVLYMPDKIVVTGNYEGDIVFTPCGDRAIRIDRGSWKEPKIVELTDMEIGQLNSLYRSITDFTNRPILAEGGENTTLYHGDRVYQFCDMFTTQPELEDYMALLFGYSNR